MGNGNLHKLGTLFVGGTKVARPTNPWRPDDGGNIQRFNSLGSGTIEIRDTDSADANKMQWIEVNKGSQKLLICDRVMLVYISWDQLNAQNLIKGKRITIDGQEYLLRVLTGGNYYRSGTDSYSGGVLPNEWDDFICNEGNYLGLPKPNPTDLAGTNPSGEHNQKWHWDRIYTWCQETYRDSAGNRALRGDNSARYWNYDSSSSQYNSYGWRPVLEVLNAAPTIDGRDEDLGEYNKSFTKQYRVTESDGETFSVEEKIDSTRIRKLDGQRDNDFIVDISDHFGGLSLGQHTIKIIATDVKGASSIRTWTFRKVNKPPVLPVVDSPKNDMRIDMTDFEVVFEPQDDVEGNNQTFTLEIADDIGFSSGKEVINRGLMKFEGGKWVPTTQATRSDIGKKFKFVKKGHAKAVAKYMRITVTDAEGSGQTVKTAPIKVKGVKILQFETLPHKPKFVPAAARVLFEGRIDRRAYVKVEICNNALDVSPTWELMSEEFKLENEHVFTNSTKTASEWAVSVRVTIDAMDATDEISLTAIGLGVREDIVKGV